MSPSPESLRLVRVAGLVAWALVGLAAALGGIGRPGWFAVWFGGFLVFGSLLAFATTPGRRGLPWALALQAACVIVMTARQCRGWEGTLLVVVALQLGLAVSRRVGLAWIAVQTVALGAAIAFHWAPRPASLLAPAYLGSQVLAFLVMEMLARETSARAALAQAHADLLSTRELLAESARRNERLRIARELHDGMGHHLAALSLNLQALDGGAPPLALETARDLTRRLLDDVESVVTALHDDPGLDLRAALNTLAAAIPRPAIHVDAARAVVSDAERAHAVLRCCQEIVTNSVKHAQASNLWIRVDVEEGVVSLSARDDGRGAARLGIGHGLVGMRRRVEEAGGTFELETRPGAGFEVRATLPAGPA
jgi:signal transduction histidine kinase